MIISIAGKAGNGKDTCALFIKNILNGYWAIKHWADPVKQVASIITGMTITELDVKKNEVVINGLTARQLYILIGTEFGRKKLGDIVWINAIMKEYVSEQDYQVGTTPENLQWVEGDYPNWIIADTRFPNEYDAVKEHNGINIRVHKTVSFVSGVHNGKKKNDLLPVEQCNLGCDHLWNLIPSGGISTDFTEISLDNHTFDYEIYASNTDELLIEVKRMLQYFKLIL